VREKHCYFSEMARLISLSEQCPCIASFRRDAGLAVFRVPPFSRSVDATKAKDCPNFFSSFC
jgi:hypothetical protein